MNLNNAWVKALRDVTLTGLQVAPRDRPTLELPSYQMTVNTRYPVLTIPERKLGYRFMAAEAYWILSGDERVETIAPYSKRISEFSDNGWTFFGAYGPKIHEQFNYVVETLIKDRESRQAVINIWRENPPATKDVPCTVSMAFQIRNNQLHAHVFMRSNDLWLGTPYDVFNFSMLTHLICAELNMIGNPSVEPGMLYLTAASSHVYQPNWGAVVVIIKSDPTHYEVVPATPEELYQNPHTLMKTLKELRDPAQSGAKGWWV